MSTLNVAAPAIPVVVNAIEKLKVSITGSSTDADTVTLEQAGDSSGQRDGGSSGCVCYRSGKTVSGNN